MTTTTTIRTTRTAYMCVDEWDFLAAHWYWYSTRLTGTYRTELGEQGYTRHSCFRTAA